VVARISGLAANSGHGFHIHDFGDLSAADGTAAGKHFNPTSAIHELTDTTPRHAGDLGNIQSYDVNGDAWYSADTTLVSDLNAVIGRAIIVHSTFDHGSGAGCDQAGGSGVRYLACVIGISTTSVPNIPVTVTINSTYENVDCVVPSNSPTPGSGSDGTGSTSSSGSRNVPLSFAQLFWL